MVNAGDKNWSFQNRVGKEKKQLARHMRKNPTMAEKTMWVELRGKKTGYKFTRQKVILGWIADFYCPSVRLVVEVDGKYHEDPDVKDRDWTRDAVLLEHGFYTVRFKNFDVVNRTKDVVFKIKTIINELSA